MEAMRVVLYPARDKCEERGENGVGHIYNFRPGPFDRRFKEYNLRAVVLANIYDGRVCMVER